MTITAKNKKGKTYTLKRRYFETGTFSTLHREDGSKVCVFVERPWLDNAANVSCIPEGEYRAKKTDSPKFGESYYLEGETVSLNGPSKRTHILIHAANLPEELHGCLAPGLDFSSLAGQWAVCSSKVALGEVMGEFDEANITIKIESDSL